MNLQIQHIMLRNRTKTDLEMIPIEKIANQLIEQNIIDLLLTIPMIMVVNRGLFMGKEQRINERSR